MLPKNLNRYQYSWPQEPVENDPRWESHGDWRTRNLPESDAELNLDSRWPAFFPAPMCIVTTGSGADTLLEKVVGASIVNRFPYVIALSFCRKPLSTRHHPRFRFMEMLERTGVAAVQFLPPGEKLDAVMGAILGTPEVESFSRLAASGLAIRKSTSEDEPPCFKDAYMVYEAELVRRSRDFVGDPIYESAWCDIGSHRVYFLEIRRIRLREDIAHGNSQIHWRSLPIWEGSNNSSTVNSHFISGYKKGYQADYRFPDKDNTVAFEYDEIVDGMAVKHLASFVQHQVEIDNDRARWPCFFPSSVGMITTRGVNGCANLMPCGSTTVLSRAPLVIAPAVSYAAINKRYKPRATLFMLENGGRFGCGVPYIDDVVLNAIRYAGNISIEDDPYKVANSGLSLSPDCDIPRFNELPVHFDCRIIGNVRLGTHILFFGEVEKIWMRKEVSLTNALHWSPWASVQPAHE